ncbi:MAG: hypothetical protein COX79_01130 [Candidatus Levybacteria bacterium CG_4_10_14_0_2_um_filter_36_16]|nr:MAG: hypothetical protein AUK12_03915 [Candidatus Levybacteria bacterium CG2_30_37_29]PIR79170.1 MAG: hypothetical protein COU26_02630 [Candidatus Levybacteria bacterium CG10_big_fil_rev_8_21_14_0_10_36_30]PIZ97737.1 MAG: hypothetical protein COX79_01130 [Candidatus Levybacteria bacterium CG_4_10_14_0_2_um_filter_36_16]PJA90702.1 MAG: hypothetical protein CO136_01035 [Candidatus Levybacteria bacterium CG_4_9_14_3_um_filter_36_7]
MLKRFTKRININFKETRNERSATQSYSNYNQKLRRVFQKANFFSKIGGNKTIFNFRKKID